MRDFFLFWSPGTQCLLVQMPREAISLIKVTINEYNVKKHLFCPYIRSIYAHTPVVHDGHLASIAAVLLVVLNSNPNPNFNPNPNPNPKPNPNHNHNPNPMGAAPRSINFI